MAVRHVRGLGLALLVALVGFGAIGVRRSLIGSGDFDGFHGWVVDMWRLGEIPADMRRYPPSFLAILSPLAMLPLEPAAITWTLLNILALARLPTTFERLTGVARWEQWPAWLAMGPVIADNLMLAQSGPLLLWLVSEGIRLVREGRAPVGGVLLGTASLLKVLPVAFFGVLAARRKGLGSLVGVALVGAAATGVLVLALGARGNAQEWNRWLSELRTDHATAEATIETGRALRYNNQALPIVLVRTLSRLEPRPKGAVALADLPQPVILGIYRAIVIGLLVVGVACAWRLRHDDERSWGEIYALIAIGQLTITPLVWTHYFLWTAPALIVLCRCRGFVLGWALLFALLLFSKSLRGLGAHMGLSIALYLTLALEIARRGPPLESGVGPCDPASAS